MCRYDVLSLSTCVQRFKSIRDEFCNQRSPFEVQVRSLAGSDQLGFTLNSKLAVSNINSSSTAYRDGLRTHHIIVSVNGNPAGRSREELVKLMNKLKTFVLQLSMPAARYSRVDPKRFPRLCGHASDIVDHFLNTPTTITHATATLTAVGASAALVQSETVSACNNPCCDDVHTFGLKNAAATPQASESWHVIRGRDRLLGGSYAWEVKAERIDSLAKGADTVICVGVAPFSHGLQMSSAASLPSMYGFKLQSLVGRQTKPKLLAHGGTIEEECLGSSSTLPLLRNGDILGFSVKFGSQDSAADALTAGNRLTLTLSINHCNALEFTVALPCNNSSHPRGPSHNADASFQAVVASTGPNVALSLRSLALYEFGQSISSSHLGIEGRQLINVAAGNVWLRQSSTAFAELREKRNSLLRPFTETCAAPPSLTESIKSHTCTASVGVQAEDSCTHEVENVSATLRGSDHRRTSNSSALFETLVSQEVMASEELVDLPRRPVCDAELDCTTFAIDMKHADLVALSAAIDVKERIRLDQIAPDVFLDIPTQQGPSSFRSVACPRVDGAAVYASQHGSLRFGWSPELSLKNPNLLIDGGKAHRVSGSGPDYYNVISINGFGAGDKATWKVKVSHRSSNYYIGLAVPEYVDLTRGLQRSDLRGNSWCVKIERQSPETLHNSRVCTL